MQTTFLFPMGGGGGVGGGGVAVFKNLGKAEKYKNSLQFPLILWSDIVNAYFDLGPHYSRSYV